MRLEKKLCCRSHSWSVFVLFSVKDYTPQKRTEYTGGRLHSYTILRSKRSKALLPKHYQLCPHASLTTRCIIHQTRRPVVFPFVIQTTNLWDHALVSNTSRKAKNCYRLHTVICHDGLGPRIRGVFVREVLQVILQVLLQVMLQVFQNPWRGPGSAL